MSGTESQQQGGQSHLQKQDLATLVSKSFHRILEIFSLAYILRKISSVFEAFLLVSKFEVVNKE